MEAGPTDTRPRLPGDAATIAAAPGVAGRRVMLFGAPGNGKSTLAGQLADVLVAAGHPCHCIGADPGSPAFGVPGAVTLATRAAGAWQPVALEPLCTLDAGRFRLPLIAAVRRLADQAGPGTLLVDSPGVVRGVAGSELLQGLVEVVAVDLLLVVTRPGRPPPLNAELDALRPDYRLVGAVDAARRPGKRARARARTAAWDRYLSAAGVREIELARLSLVGTPPPSDEPDAWSGRQVALLRETGCVAMAEVVGLNNGFVTLRVPHPADGADTLLIRDAARGDDGLLESAAPFAPTRVSYLPPAGLLPDVAADQGPRPVGRVGGVDVALVNGLFGDPLLHLRLRHRGRSLLFDLGDGSRLSARVAHRVSDVFISHAHMDHLSGFIWLLRSRIGVFPPCRLYGPPGLAAHISGLIQGFLWDRAGQRGPVFEVHELHGETLRRCRLQAGRPAGKVFESRPVADGIVHAEPGFRVRAVVLDHHTPVLAYAFEPDSELNVRKDGLQRLGLPAGPWLGELKRCWITGDRDSRLTLPDGSVASVAGLAGDLLRISPGRRLVYATDLADTADNRGRLVDLAHNAHTLFLEAAFIEADRAHAREHGHLTAQACGEIAAAAAVSRLVPFHLSHRYVDDPAVVYDEIAAVCGCLARPAVPAADESIRAGSGRTSAGGTDYGLD